jgi:hypothetical protein
LIGYTAGFRGPRFTDAAAPTTIFPDVESYLMKVRFARSTGALLIFLACLNALHPQSSSGTVSGTVTDQNGAVVPGSSITIKEIATGFKRATSANSTGRYRFVNIPPGTYSVAAEAANFSRFIQTGVTLDPGQEAVVDISLKAGDIQEVVTVDQNASLLDTATAEVRTRFDSRRLSELPIATNRNVFNVLLSVAGVGQLSPGQASLAGGIAFSANGGRLRSNNFILDGQDVNDPVFTGTDIALNNPDAIREVHIITNQFRAEYGHNSGSVANVVGKSGTNDYRGSLFWFHNNEYLNACNNLDKVASGARTGFCNKNAESETRRRAPLRRENQVGFTLGGPVTFPTFGDGDGSTFWSGRDKTFFFGDYQYWSDRSVVSGPTLSGAPTVQGREVLQLFSNRPQVQALLDFVPAGSPNGGQATFTTGGTQYSVPLGDITGSARFAFDDHQGSFRMDHRFGDKNVIYGRYRFASQDTSGAGQVTPPGMTNVSSATSNALIIVLNSILNSRFSNEVRGSWKQFDSSADAQFPLSKTIPSIAIRGLGMIGSNAAGVRTALGFVPTLPAGRTTDTYQLADAFSYMIGGHNMKFGAEVRRTDARLAVFLNTRGSVVYNSPPGQPGDISRFINDTALSATITLRMPGGDTVSFFRWWELYAFAQDEWRVRAGLTFTFGLRYEYPGDVFDYLRDVNERVVAANGDNPAFLYRPRPETDSNNFMPRVGFSWNPRTRRKGFLGLITGGDKLVLRGGYARTYDANFINIPQNVARTFPFAANQNVSTTGAFIALRSTTEPNFLQPNRFPRTVVSAEFRSPAADQFSLEIQRELAKDIVINVGYVRTRGTGLMQLVDGNPCPSEPIPGRECSDSTVGTRVDPDREVIGVYTNAAASTYDALQASFTKRLSNDFGAGLHYTWSVFIDDASDVFAASSSELSVAQDPFDRRNDRARSNYDRPHRITGNFVYELPFYRRQTGFAGRLLGGWQVNSFFTFQSGAPFTVTLGADPQCAVCGLANSVRPDLNTNLDLSGMTISEIIAAGGTSLFRDRLAPGRRVGNAGRNLLRADDLRLVDFGIIKNTRITEKVRIQLRADMFNALNTRNFGIPIVTNLSTPNGFLDKGATNGGNRRIVLGARIVF